MKTKMKHVYAKLTLFVLSTFIETEAYVIKEKSGLFLLIFLIYET